MKQGSLTRPEHLVPPPIHNALMFGGSTCCEIYVYIWMCVCAYMHVYVHICVFMCIWMYVFMYVYTCVLMY